MAKVEKVIISKGQNLVDLCIQELGSIEGLVALMRANGFTANTDPVPGTELKVLMEDVVDEKARDLFKSLTYKVNTGLVADTPEEDPEGIFDDSFDDTFE